MGNKAAIQALGGKTEQKPQTELAAEMAPRVQEGNLISPLSDPTVTSRMPRDEPNVRPKENDELHPEAKIDVNMSASVLGVEPADKGAQKHEPGVGGGEKMVDFEEEDSPVQVAAVKKLEVAMSGGK